MHKVSFRKADVEGFNIFYREAGPRDAQTLLLLHGFPSASHMFRDLVQGLADRFHVIAPDLPGFGQSDMPDRSAFAYTFHDIARVIERFPEVVGLDRFAIYVFDCCPGGEFPVGAKFESAMPLQRPASKVYDVGVDDIRLLQRRRKRK